METAATFFGGSKTFTGRLESTLTGRVTKLGRAVDLVVDLVAGVVDKVVLARVVDVVGARVVVVVVVVVSSVVVVVLCSGGSVLSSHVAPYHPSRQPQLPEAGSQTAPREQAQENRQFGPNFPAVQTIK